MALRWYKTSHIMLPCVYLYKGYNMYVVFESCLAMMQRIVAQKEIKNMYVGVDASSLQPH